MMWLPLNNQLEAMSREADRIVHQPRISINEGELPNNLAVVTDLLRPAATYCLLDGMQSAALIEQANAFAMLAASAHWSLSPLNKPDEYIHSYRQFPQVKNNTQMGLFLYERAIERAVTVMRKPSKGAVERRDGIDDSYSLADYVEDVKALHRAMLSSLDALNRACSSLSEQDKAALSAINIATRQ